MSKKATTIVRDEYGSLWSSAPSPIDVEMHYIRNGGHVTLKDDSVVGKGLFYHFKKFKSLLWPEIVWHRWNDMELECYLKYRIIGEIGSASSGKTHSLATNMLADYYCFANCTTILISSTTRESLENRIFGEIKKYHRIAKERFPFLPGNLIEGRQRIITDNRNATAEGRDFRNGICFPVGTLVDTPNGKVVIESLKTGDQVINAFGVGQVTKALSSIAKQLVRIHLSDGRTLDCTPNHPIFTDRGWVNAIDLKTCDRVFSVHETLHLLRNSESLVSESKILSELFGFYARKEMRCLQQTVPTSTKEKDKRKEVRGTILQHNLCREMAKPAQRMLFQRDREMCSLRETSNRSSSQPAVLFSEMPKTTRDHAMPSMRESVCIYFRQTQRSKNEVLREILQAEGNWEEMCSQKSNSDQRRNDGLETLSSIHCSFPYQNRITALRWVKAMVSDRYSFPEHKTCYRNRRRNSSDSIKETEGRKKNPNSGRTWVESVEILEPSSDPRYSARHFGYPVFNLEVSGHPSYSVNGVIVHNCGVPCKKGQNYQGLSEYAGIKNTRVRLGADELHFMPPDFVAAIANLNKNPDFKCVGLGNPKDVTDALGKLCEPSAEMGGWDGGIDQSGPTKTWSIRFERGICIQLVGSDSPNLDGSLGIPLISQKEIDEDIRFYGRDSLQFTMMDEGRMPRGQAARRVITRQLCQKFNAMEEPIWKDDKQTKIGFLDAAYGGTGGDRAVFGELWFGKGLEDKHLLWLKETLVVPVSVNNPGLPEDQISNFCKEQCDQRGIAADHFFFDSTGRGSLMSSFARLWSNMVGGVEFGGKASERPVSETVSARDGTTCREHYFNFVTELWWSWRLIIEGGQFRGLTEEVMNEGCMREWGFVTGNKIQVEPKDKMKIKTSRSPDLADALVAGIEGARRLGFVISKLANVANLRYNDEWKQELRDVRNKFRSKHALNYSA